MTWVYQRDDWPEWSWDSLTIRELVARAELLQARLAGRLEAYGDELALEATITSRTEEVIRSFEIEGEALDSAALKSSVAKSLGVLDYPGVKTTKSESLAKLLSDINQNPNAELDLNRLLVWHKLLFPQALGFEAGEFRDDQLGVMQVVSGPVGGERLHFEAPPAGDLKPMLSELLRWLEHSPEHNFVKAAIGQLWFLTIHPFEDGNGRVARGISELYLARSDGLGLRAYSVSREILKRRKAYYQLLEQAQRGDLDVTHWLSWFLEQLIHAIETSFGELDLMAGRSRLLQRISVKLNERQLLVLRRLLDPSFEGKITAQKLAKLGKCSMDTAQRDIAKFMELGVITKDIAGGRSTNYLISY
jgi:Fic family protein